MNNVHAEPAVDDLAAGYIAGLTLEQLADQHGLSAGAVRNRVRAAGVVLRPPGRRPSNVRVASRPQNGLRAPLFGQARSIPNRQGSWYTIEAQQAPTPGAPTTAKVWVYDEIGLDGITASDFVTQLRAIAADQIELHLNSPGGDVFDGLAIFNALKASRATTICYIDGLAASIASVIAMACDRIIIAPNASMMIHDAWGVCVGPSTDMRLLAEQLNQTSNNIAAIYHDRAAQGVKTWRSRMVAETWYSADEAVAARLADEIMTFPPKGARAAKEFDLRSAVRDGRFKYAGRRDAPAPERGVAAGPVAPADRPAPRAASTVRWPLVGDAGDDRPNPSNDRIGRAFAEALTAESKTSHAGSPGLADLAQIAAQHDPLTGIWSVLRAVRAAVGDTGGWNSNRRYADSGPTDIERYTAAWVLEANGRVGEAIGAANGDEASYSDEALEVRVRSAIIEVARERARIDLPAATIAQAYAVAQGTDGTSFDRRLAAAIARSAR